MSKVKPSYWICGGGSSINCEHWDDVNGCWCGYDDFVTCPVANEFEEQSEDEE